MHPLLWWLFLSKFNLQTYFLKQKVSVLLYNIVSQMPYKSMSTYNQQIIVQIACKCITKCDYDDCDFILLKYSLLTLRELVIDSQENRRATCYCDVGTVIIRLDSKVSTAFFWSSLQIYGVSKESREITKRFKVLQQCDWNVVVDLLAKQFWLQKSDKT